MARTKLRKLQQVKELSNVFHHETENVETDILNYFNNDKEITFEIGCGHGEYTVNLAYHFPGRNYLGIDVKGSRLFKGADHADKAGIDNVAFLISRAEKLHVLFKSLKTSEIIIPFPDPHVKRRSAKHRLVSPEFLARYKYFLTPGGRIHLKTDDEMLYNYALETIEKLSLRLHINKSNLYGDEDELMIKKVRTRYEEHFLQEGRIIKYVCFGLH
ncbi:MAG: tRNA (guanosine(46)-N7)-methyltransferase TrmB [Melioribacteraceae bacterium]|nr:tRNA (guanosine(46)-N7)-methyltransferase TrmB [Melioribacteraceae bacterium]MCF8353807.1 tRNA (guanosine(46)-N7)-methyltransferase TrmB [Melioribacteraceae bacterium]MCF8393643.1 tRNA (guanosine(46)-N7)-methyltransferase TrmB [Melioribacteraceae bacterium]MCF8419453.1 tRNA (guanosine(46)-N7)-methyltransferase TrmB [Melioribacteraceae bacterium]